ncbi:response regulator [Actinoplanes sp. NPDC051346]|uniref:response regulator n=1 Tax=Actinoplanes sp. NPDC051346 TaxID=3155048 RepID=UPI00341A7505
MADTILLTEVAAEIRAAYGLLLRRAGYHVITAADRASGLQCAVNHLPDLVVINLRDDEGPRMCLELHADPRTSHIPVLLMSAALYPNAAAAAAVGADDYLAKPLPNAELLVHVRGLLQQNAELCG